jgi:hypothetical protein
MHTVNKCSALLALLVLASSSALAADPTTIGCPTGWTPAELLVYATTIRSSGCPLLLDKEPRKSINKFGVGSTFAYPAIPDTCLSGSLSTDMTTPSTLTVGGVEYQLDPDLSYSESAQRLFPVPDGQGFPIGTDFNGTSVTDLDGSPNLFAWDAIPASLQAGAAMTVFHVEGTSGTGDSISLDLVSDDHFLLNAYGVDVEDFNVVGSSSGWLASGRFTANGNTVALEPLTIDFEISGQLCLKAKP